jgi:hypothetical protein
MCPKDTWLAARNLNHAWPMFGRPQLLVTDSAMEFKGHAFQRGCDDYGIRIRYRDRGRVHQGGVVERLLGKLNAVLATYPGSSGRAVAHRDEYPSEQRACLSNVVGRPRSEAAGRHSNPAVCQNGRRARSARGDDIVAGSAQTTLAAATLQRATRQFYVAAVLLPLFERGWATLFPASMAAGDTGFLHRAWLSIARSMSVLQQLHGGL